MWKDPKRLTSTPTPTGEKPNVSSPVVRRHYRPSLWPAYRQLLLRSQAPILAGPWRGEMGFEALYWLPFLAKLRQDGIDPERLIPVTRSGAGSWYEVPQGVELYAMRTPQDLRIENRKQVLRWGQLKQTHVTDWDRAVLKDAAESLRLRSYRVLHPAWMYQLFAPFWQGQAGVDLIERHARFTELPPPPLPDGIVLPEAFVAVKFYSRFTFPGGTQTAQFVEQTIRQIAKAHPVVLLDWDGHVDDHLGFPVPDLPNVTKLSTLLPGLLPETALAVQSAILARSLGFVGTYGGFAHLALRFRRPVVSYYWEWGGVAFAHRTISEQLAQTMGVPFHCLRVLDLQMLQAVMPQIVVQAPPKPASQLQAV